MKYAKITNFLNLEKREEQSLLQFLAAESLPKVFAIQVKIDNAPVHIDEAANYTANFNIVVLCPTLLCGSGLLNIIILAPMFAAIHVSGCQVETPYVFLFSHVLVDKEVLAAQPNADLWIASNFLTQLIDSNLKVKLRFLNQNCGASF